MGSDAKFKPQREISHIKSQIRKLEKEKEKAFPELGRATYQAFLEGQLKGTPVSESCQRLKAIDTEVEQKKKQISSLAAQAQQMKTVGFATVTVTCPHCNAASSPGMKFCGSCGKELPAAAPPQANTCPSCGTPVAVGVKFCGDCGKSITAAQAPVPAASPPAPSAAKEAAPKPKEDASKKCPSCNATIDEKDAVFCGECGASLK